MDGVPFIRLGEMPTYIFLCVKAEKISQPGQIPLLIRRLCFVLFCRFQAMVAMDLEGKIRRPRTEFDDEGVRYEHRFAPLGHVYTPPLVPYMQFKEMTRVIT